MSATPVRAPQAAFAAVLLACLSLFGADALPPDGVERTADGALASQVIEVDPSSLAPTANGAKRFVFDGPTRTMERFHAHVTRLNPGQYSGPEHRTPQEELIVVHSGTVDVQCRGRVQRAPAGSIIFFASNELERMHNSGPEPAVYYVVQVFTDRTPPATRK